MKSFAVAALCLVAVALAQRTPPQRTPSHRTPSQHNPPPPPAAPEPTEQPPSNTPPEVNWGKCPQLEPTLAEQRAKGEVIEQCLEKHPLPTESTPSQEEVEAHRETITTCALEAEGWFNSDGTYKFERAKKEIEGKSLKVASDILLKHDDCTKEAMENFPDRNIQQVQLYQACMDYHITKICDIQITAAEPTEE